MVFMSIMVDKKMAEENNFDLFWSLFPADLCRGAKNKGGKGKARESWDKHVKDPEMVVSALQAQIRYDRDAKNKGEDVMRWPFASTWLNQSRWDVEIESHAELQQRHEAKFCHCGRETHGPTFNECAFHLNFDANGKFKIRTGTTENGNKTFIGQMVNELREYARTHVLDHKSARDNINQLLEEMRNART